MGRRTGKTGVPAYKITFYLPKRRAKGVFCPPSNHRCIAATRREETQELNLYPPFNAVVPRLSLWHSQRMLRLARQDELPPLPNFMASAPSLGLLMLPLTRVPPTCSAAGADSSQAEAGAARTTNWPVQLWQPNRTGEPRRGKRHLSWGRVGIKEGSLYQYALQHFLAANNTLLIINCIYARVIKCRDERPQP